MHNWSTNLVKSPHVSGESSGKGQCHIAKQNLRNFEMVVGFKFWMGIIAHYFLYILRRPVDIRRNFNDTLVQNV